MIREEVRQVLKVSRLAIICHIANGEGSDVFAESDAGRKDALHMDGTVPGQVGTESY